MDTKCGFGERGAGGRRGDDGGVVQKGVIPR